MPIYAISRPIGGWIGHLLLAAALLIGNLAIAQELSPMTQVARGTFSVKIQPDGDADTQDGVSVGRMKLDKVFEGDLVGTGLGTMLTTQNASSGAAVYVAIERVSGTLGGRKGTFVFQHLGTMTSTSRELSIRVVPDSGTGELTGLSGVFTLTIKDGVHAYSFDYTLAKAP